MSRADNFVKIIRTMSMEKVKRELEGAKKILSEDGYLFFENLILTIRESETI